RAGLQDDFVQFEEFFVIGKAIQFRRQLWKLQTVLAGAGLVEDLAQPKHIGLRSAWPLGGNEAFGADIRGRFTNAGYQADIRQLGDTVYKNDIGRFYVPV